MKNVTIAPDESAADWARMEAPQSRRLASSGPDVGWRSCGTTMPAGAPCTIGGSVIRRSSPMSVHTRGVTATTPSGSIVFADSDAPPCSEGGAASVEPAVARWRHGTHRRPRCGRVGTQVLNGLVVNARREWHPPVPAHDARAEVHRRRRWQPWLVDPARVEAARSIRSRLQLNGRPASPDAAGRQHGCETIETKGLRHDQPTGCVRSVDPSLIGPGVPHSWT